LSQFHVALEVGSDGVPIRSRVRSLRTGSQPERFSWEESDGIAESFPRRGESEARADGRPVTSKQ
jgi:hypothetical protein